MKTKTKLITLFALSAAALLLPAQEQNQDATSELFNESTSILSNRWEEAEGAAAAPSLLTRPQEDTGDDAIKIQTESGSKIELHGDAEQPEKFVAPEGLRHDSRTDRLLNAAQKYMEEGELASAERAYLRALENYPTDAEIRFRLSTLYIAMNRGADAIRLLKGLIEEYPDNPLLYNNLAWVYATGGRVRSGELALRYAREALMLSPYMPSIWNTLAEAYYISGSYEKAARVSMEALILLSKTNPSQQEIQSFQLQQAKIQRANRAWRILQGMDEYDN